MSGTTHLPAATGPDIRLRTFDRYADLSLADNTTVIYDRENPQRWIQSDTTVTLDEAP